MRQRQPSRRTVLFGALALLLCGALLGAARESWEGKPPSEWTLEEALKFFEDSPWAREETVYQPSGRILGVIPGGRKVVYQENANLPPRQYSVSILQLEPEMLVAKYAVRWSSARIVQQGLERLKELSSVHAEMQAPAPDVPEDKIVVTARSVEPPRQSSFDRLNQPTIRDESGRPVQETEPTAPDLFSGLSEAELAAAAELRLHDGQVLKPERIAQHGLGASEGVTFYFPRTLPTGTKEVEFVFHGQKDSELKAKFKLREMEVNGKPDY